MSSDQSILNRIVYILGNCSYIDENLTVCDNVHTSTFERLVKEDLAQIGDALSGAPTNGEILDLAQWFPEVTLQCVIISHQGEMPRVYLNGARASGKLSTEFIIDFATLMRKADKFKLGTKKVSAEFLVREN